MHLAWLMKFWSLAPLCQFVASALFNVAWEPSDFDARSACQPDESALCNLATTVIDNSAADNSLFEQLDSWLACHGFIDTPDKEEADA